MQSTIEILSRRLGELLLAQHGWLATAESCTGGLLAGAVTSVAGSSGWFDQGWVTYSNDAKERQLGVVSQTIAHFGAVHCWPRRGHRYQAGRPGVVWLCAPCGR